MTSGLFARARLYSGLVLFAYVLGHLANHALGLISLEAMESGTIITIAPWHSLPGTIFLTGAALVHIAVALISLYRRRILRMRPWEIAQIVLGLAIPFLITHHIVATRLSHEIYHIQPSYSVVQVALWYPDASQAIKQAAALLVVWVHACIGLHFWLRIRPWYASASPYLYAGALLIPALSLAGFVASGMAVRQLIQTPEWLDGAIAEARFTPEVGEFVIATGNFSMLAFLGLVILVLIARGIRAYRASKSDTPRLHYSGKRSIPLLAGATALESIRAAGIQHASVCGGRGRCSTCRVRIDKGEDTLPPPEPQEKKVLDRVGLPPNVRLACQIRPTSSIEVSPLLPPTATARDASGSPSYLQGDEREIAILFCDLRGFTTFSHKKLPYDVVFVLNRYFAAMGEAIEQAGGRLDKFLGDGVMALFGIERGSKTGCENAIEAARRMVSALNELNDNLKAELPEPLRIGIGIHIGPAIVGEMGYGRARSLTAIGDAVNTASRLEEMTKTHKVQLVASDAVLGLAGLDVEKFEAQEVVLRGQSEPLKVRIIPSTLEL